jgi:peroxiredoxin Q/BCP
VLAPGDPAPAFDGVSHDGRRVSLAALRGRVVVVYFFPKAFTLGCTIETKGFRDNYPELRELGAEVIGISTDSPAKQCDFAKTHGVTFPMVGDESHDITKQFGVLWPLLGVAKRVTFVIDEDGVVRHVFRHEVQVSKHLDDVLHAVRKLEDARSRVPSTS